MNATFRKWRWYFYLNSVIAGHIDKYRLCFSYEYWLGYCRLGIQLGLMKEEERNALIAGLMREKVKMGECKNDNEKQGRIFGLQGAEN